MARVNLRLGATILVEVVLGLAADQVLIEDGGLIVSGLGRIGEPCGLILEILKLLLSFVPLLNDHSVVLASSIKVALGVKVICLWYH